MSDLTHAVVSEALDYLVRITRDGVCPPEARAMLRGIEARYPGMRLELIWLTEKSDQSIHYDVLIRRPGGTISLSYCFDRALPWPMRGAQRWSDADLVRVNSIVLQVTHAISLFDTIWADKRIMQRLIDSCLIDEDLAREPVEVSDSELQRAMDGFRRSRKLFTAEATQNWMARRELTQARLEDLMARQVRVAAVRERVTAGQIETHFAAYADDFDTARIARFDVADAADAAAICATIRDGALDFLAAAQRAFLASSPDIDTFPIFATVRREDIEPALADAVFAATPGAILDPVPTNAGHAIVQVLSMSRAQLDSPTRTLVQKRLFKHWLIGQRKTANVEWNWGRSEQTGPL